METKQPLRSFPPPKGAKILNKSVMQRLAQGGKIDFIGEHKIPKGTRASETNNLQYTYKAIFGLSVNRLKQCGAPIVDDEVTKDFVVKISDCGNTESGGKTLWNVSWKVYVDDKLVGSNIYQY